MSRAVRTSSTPYFSSSRTIGRKNGTCGELSISIQIFFPWDVRLERRTGGTGYGLMVSSCWPVCDGSQSVMTFGFIVLTSPELPSIRMGRERIKEIGIEVAPGGVAGPRSKERNTGRNQINPHECQQP